MAKTNPAAPVRVIEETPAYWRVVFEYPPFNIVDATMFEGLQDLLVRMDTRQSLRVVVFESANPDFYLAHFDLTGKTGNITTAGPADNRGPVAVTDPPFPLGPASLGNEHFQHGPDRIPSCVPSRYVLYVP